MLLHLNIEFAKEEDSYRMILFLLPFGCDDEASFCNKDAHLSPELCKLKTAATSYSFEAVSLSSFDFICLYLGEHFTKY